jgi:tetratricopeptide (TPR) repeat protein
MAARWRVFRTLSAVAVAGLCFVIYDTVWPDYKYKLEMAWYEYRMARNARLLNLASNHIDAGRYEKAVGIYSRLIDDRYCEAATLLRRSNAYRFLERNELALADLDRAIALGLEGPTGYVRRAELRWKAKQFAAAVEDCKKAEVRLYSTSLPMAGGLLADDANAKSASSDWRRMLNTKAACLAGLERFEEALATADQAVGMFPKDEVSFHHRGTIRGWCGNWEGARYDFEEALRLSVYDDVFDDSSVLVHGAVLADFLATCPDDRWRDGQRALHIATINCEGSKYADMDSVAALAAAHAELGDFVQAARWQEKAITLGGQPPADIRQAQLAAYRQHKPYREKAKR